MKIFPKFQNSGKFPSREYIKRKLQFLNLNGIKVKIDGRWGPWQELLYKKLTTKNKHYNTTPLGFLSYLYDKTLGDGTTYQEDPAIVKGYSGEIKLDNRSNTRRYIDQLMQDNKTPLGYITLTVLPSVAVASSIVYGFPAIANGIRTAVSNPSTILPAVKTLAKEGIKGITGAIAVNTASKATTGKTWGEHIALSTGVSSGFGEFTNPGFILGSPAYNIGKNLYIKESKYLSNNFPFFIKTPNSYTRGLGIGNEGILDLILTGIVRGNPRGTEVTANYFAKLFRKNRNHFRDIMKDTGIKNIESKYFSRTLNKSEFNAIKEAARKYKSNSFDVENNTIRFRSNSDPLSEYNTYDEYVNLINKLIEKVNLMPQKVSNGEVEVNPVLILGEDGYLRGIPIKERFGPNSDYIGDGTPLTYWYPDGRNAFRKGYDYAGSKWMVKVDNADKHLPFMHELHLHPSFFKAIKLNDPDVTVYRRLPFGIGLKIPKFILYSQ